MKLMKVNWKMKNMMKKSFEHDQDMMIDLREENENVFDSMHVNSEFLSNEIDESSLSQENMINESFEHDEKL
jgi:hypothetical protein